jgi:uncharacterized caspase-like protein
MLSEEWKKLKDSEECRAMNNERMIRGDERGKLLKGFLLITVLLFTVSCVSVNPQSVPKMTDHFLCQLIGPDWIILPSARDTLNNEINRRGLKCGRWKTVNQNTHENVPDTGEKIPQIAEAQRPGVEKVAPEIAKVPTIEEFPVPQVPRHPALGKGIGEKWAVIIGISRYQDTRVPALRYASADAQAFYEWVISPQGGRYAPARVHLLIDQQATGNNIKSALFVWLKQALEEDMVTIYFAGHGSPESPDSPDNLFLLPYDTDYDNLSVTGFPMWDIETALKRFIQAKKVVVLTDACHAGGIGQTFDVARRGQRDIQVNPINSGLQNLAQMGDGVAVLNASDVNQFSQESERWGGGHGVFTFFLVKGLNGAADYNGDGSITLGELIPFLSEQVRRETKNAQSPTVAGRFDPALTIAREGHIQ